MTAQATAPRLTAAERRVRWAAQVWDLVKAERNFEAVEMLTECIGLGRSRGWQGACHWFAEHLTRAMLEPPSDAEEYARWLAIQSLIWFGRES